MRSAKGDTSNEFVRWHFSPVSVDQIDAWHGLCPGVIAASLVRPFCLAGLCRTGYRKNRSIGRVSSCLPSNRPCRGRCPAVARAPLCQIWRWQECVPAPTMKPGCGPDLWTGSVMLSYSASKFLAAVGRQHELLADQVQHVLLGLRVGEVGVQKVMTQTPCRFLQVVHPEGAYRLNDIGSDGSKWHIHPRFSF